MKKHKLLSLVIAILISLLSYSQEKTITGIVSDETGPIPGASILIKGTHIGAVTDMDGHFSLKARIGQDLLFNYVGFETLEQKITEDLFVFNVKLKESPVQIKESINDPVHCIKRNPIAEFQRISCEDIEQAIKKPESDTKDLSNPSKDVNVTIDKDKVAINHYGFRSTLARYNVPIYVLNGVEITKEEYESLNPKKIISTTHLEGTSATALYGCNAAAGAYIISTKTMNKKDWKKLNKLSDTEKNTYKTLCMEEARKK
ncbi:carboxypeptidase-like regulatory domain-containing protein [Flavobacterium sp. SUN046]|uniref:carboxypeptidase-like regulatory domain-containing protein n=1 Tax=Flavobacterium sp. SUN046 TaxID=3002440 RepID=UPI002DB76D32|nr:carboxypeptidase-like regulatory domain-containing protein [Flavobacterium sp. SUN046]MEC4049399.1 carboxypeptidase-like regulatory domain-containing protein [Flavobacterium sp. SUN046]